MAFGIGTSYQTGHRTGNAGHTGNTGHTGNAENVGHIEHTGNAGHIGQIRGRQQEVACECWFTSTGKLMPLMLKLMDEDGECRTIRPVIVHSSEKKMYAGTPFIEFDCEIVVGEQRMRVWLIYHQSENRWTLNFR